MWDTAEPGKLGGGSAAWAHLEALQCPQQPSLRQMGHCRPPLRRPPLGHQHLAPSLLASAAPPGPKPSPVCPLTRPQLVTGDPEDQMWPLPPGGSWLGGRGRRGVTAAWPINSWPHQPGSHEGLGPDGSPDSWPLVWGRWESGPGGCVHRARGICASCRLQGPLGSARSPPAHPRALNSSGARGGVSADPPPPPRPS